MNRVMLEGTVRSRDAVRLRPAQPETVAPLAVLVGFARATAALLGAVAHERIDPIDLEPRILRR